MLIPKLDPPISAQTGCSFHMAVPAANIAFAYLLTHQRERPSLCCVGRADIAHLYPANMIERQLERIDLTAIDAGIVTKIIENIFCRLILSLLRASALPTE
jgi:hypothetical protein